MYVFSIILLGIATNLDNLCISMAFGAKKRRIAPLANLVISLISGAFAYIAALLGVFLSSVLASLAGTIGSLILVGFGLWTLIFFKPEAENGGEKPFRIPEAALLGVTLALNCLPAALGAGAAGVWAPGIGISIAVFSFLSIHLGVRLGLKLSRLCSDRLMNTISSALLIAVGVAATFI